MTLTDTGPLCALVNRNDPHGAKCIAALPHLTRPIITTWPVVTEAMYILHRDIGWSGQDMLWGLIDQGTVQIVELSIAERVRMRELMRKYSDMPMAIADASLIVVAESHGYDRVFSIDSDFHIYRLANGKALEVVPG